MTDSVEMNGTKHNIRHRIPDQKPVNDTSSTQNKPQPFKQKSVAIFAVIVIVIVAVILILKPSTSTPSVAVRQIRVPPPGVVYEQFPEFMYEFPANTAPKSAAGIIFFAHGCSHSATDWWPSSNTCPECLGLPEERKLIKFFLSNKFIVIVMSSHNRDHKCWNSREDTPIFMEVMAKFKQEYGIEKLPLYAFGASSGGGFVGTFLINKELVTKLGLKGVFVQISVIRMNLEDVAKAIHVPVMFIPMVKDKHLNSMVDDELQIFALNGDKLSRKCELRPLPIDETFFYRQIGEENDVKIDMEASKMMHEALKDAIYLDDKGYLIHDPRQSDWRDVISAKVLSVRGDIGDTLVADSSPISEEMNVAWGKHEISAQCKEKMLKFIQDLSRSS